MKNRRILISLFFLSCGVLAAESRIICKLKAFNVYWDENFKTPEDDTIKKISIFEPGPLTIHSDFQGLLLEMKALPSQELKKYSIKTQVVFLNKAQRAISSFQKTRTLKSWTENKDYSVISDLNPSELLSAPKLVKPSRLEIKVYFEKKLYCQSDIDIPYSQD